MRTFVAGCVAAGMLVSQAGATGFCARPAEKTAFDVAGLKSQLMVTALSCAAQERYNAFVIRFRTGLVAQDRTLTSYFGRAFGRHAQAQHDDYVTSLANEQSEEGSKLGGAFCQQKVVMFDEVMALPNPTDLPIYATGKSIAQPIALVSCPVSAGRTHAAKHKRPTHA